MNTDRDSKSCMTARPNNEATQNAPTQQNWTSVSQALKHAIMFPSTPHFTIRIEGVQRGVCSSSVPTGEVWRHGYIAVLIGGIMFALVAVHEKRWKHLCAWLNGYVILFFISVTPQFPTLVFVNLHITWFGKKKSRKQHMTGNSLMNAS